MLRATGPWLTNSEKWLATLAIILDVAVLVPTEIDCYFIFKMADFIVKVIF